MTKKEIKRTIKYILFSASGTLVGFGTQFLLQWIFKLDDTWAYCLSMVVVVVWTFTFNRAFTFRAANNVPIAMMKSALYYLIFIPCSGVINAELIEAGIPWIMARFMLSAVNFAGCYYYDKLVVFGKCIDTNKTAKQEQKAEELKAEETTKPQP